MTEKELMEGMNHIDDDLIEEAASDAMPEKEEAMSDAMPEKKDTIPAEGAGVTESGDKQKVVKTRRRREFRIPSAMAAGICLVILAGGAWAGKTIISQNRQLAQMQDAMSSQSDDGEAEAAAEEETGRESSDSVGIAGTDIGDAYVIAGTYRELYDSLADRGAAYKEVVYDGSITDGAEMADEAAGSSASAATSASAEGETGNGYSSTNVMTEGVDESDTVKTDGDYIYMVQSGSVKITDIREGKPGEEKELMVSLLSPSDTIEELYVDDDRMTVIFSHAERKNEMDQAAWYGADNDYKSQTGACVYDISDPMDPELIGSMVQDGFYDTSRKVGDVVYLFTEQSMVLPSMDNVTEDTALQEDNLNRWIPCVNGEPIAADCIWVPETGYYAKIISSFRVDTPDQPLDAKVILNDYSQVYVSADHIYLYGSEYVGQKNITEITSFSYEDGKITAGETTTVSGYVGDSFAIQEVNDQLVVLATDYSGDSCVNILFLFDEQLRLTGRIDEIARGEQIYAARYFGTTACFITYENHDPMYVADLSDPSNPKILGQVEISGFSDYLHVWDETHILGIGYETDESSNRLGMKLVMFDVSDPADPVIENTMVIRNRKYLTDPDDFYLESTTVSGEYKGILADPEENLIGFAYLWRYWAYGEANEPYYSVFSYDSETGFTEELTYRVSLENVSAYRGLYSGDWFYIAGRGEVTAFDRTKNFEEAS